MFPPDKIKVIMLFSILIIIPAVLMADGSMLFPADSPLLECPPGGYYEGEPLCADNYDDNFNSGCAGFPVVFQDVVAGDIICAESGTFLYDGLNMRDSDWYQIALNNPGALSWTVEAEFDDILIVVIAANSGNCYDYELLGSAAGPCCLPVSLTFDVPAGLYWLWAAPAVFDGIACGSRYNAWVDFEPAYSCDYAVGDVNNSGDFSGLDITYGVNYFKGGNPPAYECECTPGETWHVSGDVNGSCGYDGLDITYGVLYLKGLRDALLPCADCGPNPD